MKAGWIRTTLDDICIVDWGNTQLTKSAYVEDGSFLAVSASGCDGRIGHKEHAKFTPVLSAIGAQCGKMFLPEEDFTAIKNTITLTPREGVCTGRFLFQLLSHIDLPKRGAAQPFISKGDIKAFQVSIPTSLTEQQRIVDILDEAFEVIATARANAEQNRHNARALFESHLQSVFSQRGDGWSEAKLSECFRLKSGDALTSKEMISGEYSVYGGNGIAGTHNTFNLSGNNVIIGRVGALCGNARNIEEPIWLTDNAFQVTDLKYDFDYAFLTYLLNFKNLRSLARQSAQPVISNSSLKDLILNFPNIIEQRNIVIQLDALSNKTQHLESLYQRKIAALDELKQSLLQQAFSGQL